VPIAVYWNITFKNQNMLNV